MHMANSWQEFSRDLSDVIARVGKSIVAVDARVGHTSSGIVWRADSVLTAAHAIRSDVGIRVIVGPGQAVQARLSGIDRGTDTAILKLDREIESPPAQFGSTASLAIGEFAVAIARTRRGNIVASSGIISGLMGEWRIARTRIDQFIRPDLNLYPGFSGSALVASDGSVLGLNTNGLVRGKPITIPSSTLTRVAEEIATKGHVTQPYIGIAMQPVSIPESLQSKAGVNVKSGLLLMHVEPGGPADAAGAILGDILIEMGARVFDDIDDLQEVLSQAGVGHDMQTTLIRGGTKLQIAIRIGERPVR
jgi:S1-C subfamily serine protease